MRNGGACSRAHVPGGCTCRAPHDSLMAGGRAALQRTVSMNLMRLTPRTLETVVVVCRYAACKLSNVFSDSVSPAVSGKSVCWCPTSTMLIALVSSASR